MSQLKTFITVVLAMVLVLAGYEWYNKKKTQEQMYAVYIAEGLSLGTGIKNSVSAFYADTGKFPSSNEDLQLQPPETYAGQSLKGMKISSGGVITLIFDSKSGIENGTIKLTPKVGQNEAEIKWECRSPSYKKIALLIPTCRYE